MSLHFARSCRDPSKIFPRFSQIFRWSPSDLPTAFSAIFGLFSYLFMTFLLVQWSPLFHRVSRLIYYPELAVNEQKSSTSENSAFSKSKNRWEFNWRLPWCRWPNKAPDAKRLNNRSDNMVPSLLLPGLPQNCRIMNCTIVRALYASESLGSTRIHQ